MERKMKNLAKSLHTVTVLVSVARHLKSQSTFMTWEYAVEVALTILGYGVAPDPYHLKLAALKQLERH